MEMMQHKSYYSISVLIHVVFTVELFFILNLNYTKVVQFAWNGP